MSNSSLKLIISLGGAIMNLVILKPNSTYELHFSK